MNKTDIAPALPHLLPSERDWEQNEHLDALWGVPQGVPDACGRDIRVLNLGHYSNPSLRDQVGAEFIDSGVTSIYSV